MKLSKQVVKEQKQIYELIQSKDTFTYDELEMIYEKFNEGYLQDVTSHSAYFTPLDLAYDFALFAGRYGTVVDMCAGIGVLSFALLTRDTYEKNIKQIVAIERNEVYYNLGKKLLPQVDWILGDMFDKSVWDGIREKYGKIHCVNSNPPFGKVSKTDADRSWLKYKGADIEMAAIEIAMLNAERCSFILPQGSCDFRYSGRHYYEEIENRKTAKLKKETGIDFYMYGGDVDTSVYKDEWRNTKVTVEVVTIDQR